MRNCDFCSKHINIAEILDCVLCKRHYHYKCMSIPSDFYKSNIQDLERKWICPECQKRIRSNKHDDTPVRLGIRHPFEDEACTSNDNQNMEDRTTHNQSSNLTLTPGTNITDTQQQTSQVNTITIDQISSLLDQKLEKNSQLWFDKIFEMQTRSHSKNHSP